MWIYELSMLSYDSCISLMRTPGTSGNHELDAVGKVLFGFLQWNPLIYNSIHDVPACILWCYKCVSFPKLLHVMEMHKDWEDVLGPPPHVLLAVNSSHFPDHSALLLNPQLLTAGPVTVTSSASSSHSQHDIFAQSNLPQLGLFHWSALAAAAVISQLLT